MIFIYSLIAFLILSIFFLFRWIRKEKEDVGPALFGACFMSTLFAVFLSFVAHGIMHSCYGEYKLSVSQRIISLGVSEGLNGSFVLGTGTIDNRRSYIYRIQNEIDGPITEHQCRVDSSALYEINVGPETGQPRIEVLQKQVPIEWTIFNKTGESYCKLFIPKGSVIKEFKP